MWILFINLNSIVKILQIFAAFCFTIFSVALFFVYVFVYACQLVKM